MTAWTPEAAEQAAELVFHPAAGAVYLAALGLLLWNRWRRFTR